MKRTVKKTLAVILAISIFFTTYGAFADSVFAAKINGWQTIGGKDYYFYNGEVLNGKYGMSYLPTKEDPLKTGEYYFGHDNAKTTGWQRIGTRDYYFLDTGILAEGKQKYNNVEYYFDGGQYAQGWVVTARDEDGNVTEEKLVKNGLLLNNEWLNLYGEWYYATAGVGQAVGWKEIGGKNYYFDNVGHMYDEYYNSFEFDGKTYRIDEDGARIDGWYCDDWYGALYYFKGADGMIKDTITTIDGKEYKFRTDGSAYTNMTVYEPFTLNGTDYAWINYNDKGQRTKITGTGWVNINTTYYGNVWVYFKDSKLYVNKLETITESNNGKFLFGYDGIMQTGYQTFDSKEYFFNEKGYMQTGFQLIDDAGNKGFAYFSPETATLGQQVTTFTDGKLTISAKDHYFDEDGIALCGKVGEKFYNPDGTETTEALLKSKWVACQGKWFYFDKELDLVTGYNKIGNSYFYLDDFGVMLTGVQFISSLNTFKMFDDLGYQSTTITKWINIGKYYSDTDNWVYFEKGVAAKGWRKLSGKWYYLNNNGIMATGIIWFYNQTNRLDEYYYLDQSGAMKTGWVKIPNSESGLDYFYADNSGKGFTGWVKSNAKWYYIYEGEMYRDQISIIPNGKIYEFYMFSKTGAMMTGWGKFNDNWYYASSNGVCVREWQKIKNVWYYFENTGSNINSPYMYDGDDYMVYPDKSRGEYAFDKNGKMITGWQKVDGYWYYYNTNGKKQYGWAVINGKDYYFNQDGIMYTGWQYVPYKNVYKWYNFGASTSGAYISGHYAYSAADITATV